MISRNLLLVYGFVYIHMNRLSTQLFHCVGGDRAPAPSAPTADRSVGLHCTSKECARLKHALTRPLESAHIALHTWAKCQKLAKNLIQEKIVKWHGFTHAGNSLTIFDTRKMQWPERNHPFKTSGFFRGRRGQEFAKFADG